MVADIDMIEVMIINNYPMKLDSMWEYRGCQYSWGWNDIFIYTFIGVRLSHPVEPWITIERDNIYPGAV